MACTLHIIVAHNAHICLQCPNALSATQELVETRKRLAAAQQELSQQRRRGDGSGTNTVRSEAEQESARSSAAKAAADAAERIARLDKRNQELHTQLEKATTDVQVGALHPQGQVSASWVHLVPLTLRHAKFAVVARSKTDFC